MADKNRHMVNHTHWNIAFGRTFLLISLQLCVITHTFLYKYDEAPQNSHFAYQTTFYISHGFEVKRVVYLRGFKKSIFFAYFESRRY